MATYTQSRRNKLQPRITRVLSRGCCKCGIQYSGNRVAISKTSAKQETFCEVHILSDALPPQINREVQLNQAPFLGHVVYASCAWPREEHMTIRQKIEALQKK